MAKDATFLQYFPNNWAEGKGPSRTYFFDVLNTLYPQYLAQIMSHSNKQRHMATGEAMANERIKISESWQEQLQSMPYLSSKCQLTQPSPILTSFFLLQENRARPSTSSRPPRSRSSPGRRERRSLYLAASKTSRRSRPRRITVRRVSRRPPRSWPSSRRPRSSRRSRMK